MINYLITFKPIFKIKSNLLLPSKIKRITQKMFSPSIGKILSILD